MTGLLEKKSEKKKIIGHFFFLLHMMLVAYLGPGIFFIRNISKFLFISPNKIFRGGVLSSESEGPQKKKWCTVGDGRGAPESYYRSPPQFFPERNRRFQNQLPVVSPETRSPSTPRRHRSVDRPFCTPQEKYVGYFFVQEYPSLRRAALKTFVKENRWLVVS